MIKISKVCDYKVLCPNSLMSKVLKCEESLGVTFQGPKIQYVSILRF